MQDEQERRNFFTTPMAWGRGGSHNGTRGGCMDAWTGPLCLWVLPSSSWVSQVEPTGSQGLQGTVVGSPGGPGVGE